MPTFQVAGPFEVPTYRGKAAKIVDSERLADFWDDVGPLARRRGCYLFAVRAGKGIRPVYVGKASQTFKQEVFAVHKLAKYQACLADLKKGTPVVFLLLSPSGKGKPNKTAIGELEDFLIQTAVSRNPNLLNVKGTKREDWAIAGVVRSGVGKPSAAARLFRVAMGL